MGSCEMMKLQALELANFRCFSRLRIGFDERLTVLVARNGKGKSSVLDAIRILLDPVVTKFMRCPAVHAGHSDLRIIEESDRGHQVEADALNIAADFSAEGECLSVSREFVNGGRKTTMREVRPLMAFAENLKKERQLDPSRPWPLIAYYGTGRLWSAKKGKNRLDLAKPPVYGYEDCLAEVHDFRAVRDWLTKAVRKSHQESTVNLRIDEVVAAQLECVRRALDDALRAEGYSAEFAIDIDTEELMLRQEKASGAILVPISGLSDGVKAVLGLVADMALRCSRLNPSFGADASKRTAGIALIDEIDLHLHPSWQQIVLSTLREIFPLVQFIVTTHSPQVISSVPKNSVRIIDDDGLVDVKQPTEGVEVGDILRGIFGTSPTPQNLEIVGKLERLIALTSEGKGATSEWLQLYSELVGYYGESYGPLQGTVRHKEFLARINSERRHA